MNDEEWYKESHWRLNRVTKFFKPAELRVIVDFLATAEKERERETTEEMEEGGETH